MNLHELFTQQADGILEDARRYVSLASRSRVPTLNLQSLFTGTEG